MAALKTYVINLDRSPERLTFMQEQFARLGMAFERLAAVDGSSISDAEADAFAAARPIPKREYWSRGQIGAFRSHTAAWERLVASGDHAAAVLEDDAHLAADLPRLLEDDSWIPADADLVRLEGMGVMKLARGRRLRMTAGRKLHRSLAGTWGAAGYVVTRKGAEALLQAPPQSHILIDHFMFSPRLSSIAATLNRYQIVPSLCIQDQLLGDDGLGLGSITTPTYRPENRRKKDNMLLSLLRPYSKIQVDFRP